MSLSTTLAVLGIGAFFSAEVARLLLAESASHEALWVCLSAFPMLTFANIRVGILTAHHHVKAVALQNVLSAALSAVATISAVYVLRENAVFPAVLINPLIRWLTAVLFCKYSCKLGLIVPSGRGSFPVVRDMLRIGAPLTASTLIGPGVSALVPALVVRSLGTEGVAYFQASSLISMSLFGVLVAGLSQDFFPRISRMPPGTEAFYTSVKDQTRLVLLAAGVAVIALTLLAPWLVPLVLSTKFFPVLEILRWQLLGILFQLAGAPSSFAILAHLRGIHFFLPALVTGAILIPVLMVFGPLLGEAGVGLAFCVSGVGNWVCLQGIARFKLKLCGSAKNLGLLATAVATVLLVELPRIFEGIPHAVSLGLGGAVLLVLTIKLMKTIGRPHSIQRPTADSPSQNELVVLEESSSSPRQRE